MTNVVIIRVGRDQHRIAWGGTTLLKEINGCRAIPYVVHVSGGFPRHRHNLLFLIDTTVTIKHAQLAAITHNWEVIARFRAKSKLPGELYASSWPYRFTFGSIERHIKILILNFWK